METLSSSEREILPMSEGLESAEREVEQDKFYDVPQRVSYESPETVMARSEPPSYQDNPSDQDKASRNFEAQERVESIVQKRQKRWLRLPLWLFNTLLVGIVLIIIAAVLGGVLGSRKNHDSVKKNPPGTNTTGTVTTLPKPLSSSGMATLYPPMTNTMLLYYQLPNGSVIEASLPAKDFSDALTNATKLDWTIVTTSTDLISPLAVTDWQDTSNTTVRSLFFT
ncbi:hypothetical protein BDV97DRAFT_423686, partial [Delphinella strobiligena]